VLGCHLGWEEGAYMETGAAPVVVVGRQGSFVEEEMGRDG